METESEMYADPNSRAAKVRQSLARRDTIAKTLSGLKVEPGVIDAVLGEFRDQIEEARARGVSIARIAEALHTSGVVFSVGALRQALSRMLERRRSGSQRSVERCGQRSRKPTALTVSPAAPTPEKPRAMAGAQRVATAVAPAPKRSVAPKPVVYDDEPEA